MEIISVHLAAKVDEAAAFFNNAPLVLDLSRIRGDDCPDLIDLVHLLREHGFMPMGLSGADEQYNQAAHAMGLALLTSAPIRQDKQKKDESLIEKIIEEVNGQKSDISSQNGRDESLLESEENSRPGSGNEQPREAPQGVVNRIVTTPVRSGQRVVVPQGDLIITASVGSGAEIIAAGNIHVYGTLGGRAIAGSKGDENARIFCKRLDADLISIAGVYQVNEDFDDAARSVPVQIHLHGESLVMTEL